ncbi:precursor of CEP9-like protein, partial [Tanacetum coccineum]
EGRLLKSIKKQHPLRNAESHQDSPADGVPSAGLHVAEKKETFPPKVAAQSQEFGRSEPESVNDFRPTTPGNSPGAGHSFPENRPDTQTDVKVGVPAVAQSIPTGPGHSPGVGHPKQDQVVKTNA